MLEIIKVIALLCQISPSAGSTGYVEKLDKYQLKCQKEYIRCVTKKNHSRIILDEALEQCILEREVK